MWNYLSLLPVILFLWAIAGIWIVFAIAVVNGSVDLNEGFPFISICGSYAPQSCIFGQVLNIGAALAANLVMSLALAHFSFLAVWICIVRHHQLRDWGVKTWQNQLILWSGILCALGTSIVGNFQDKNQKPTHLAGAFLAFILGNLYFWLQFFLSWWMKGLPQPGPHWIKSLRLSLCSLSTILIVANRISHQNPGWPGTDCVDSDSQKSEIHLPLHEDPPPAKVIVLHARNMRSASAICEWVVAMLLFMLFGFFAVDFSSLRGCTLHLHPHLDSSLPQAPSGSPNIQMAQVL